MMVRIFLLIWLVSWVVSLPVDSAGLNNKNRPRPVRVRKHPAGPTSSLRRTPRSRLAPYILGSV
ncbi:hypothetical protein FRC12_001616 [Ceratobasidium sp. 428]|nr:hypothetical protein FRC12_001616 [Ceratobasidium sp. 428]